MSVHSVPVGHNFVIEGDPHEYRLESRVPGFVYVTDLFTGEVLNKADEWMASARSVGRVLTMEQKARAAQAAPELLEALKDLAERVAGISAHGCMGPSCSGCALIASIAAARALITRVEGKAAPPSGPPCHRRYVNGTICINPEPCTADHSKPDPAARLPGGI